MNNPLKLLLKPFRAVKDVKEGSDVVSKQIQARVQFFYNNRFRSTGATITPDYREVIPNGINVRVENKHSYIDDQTGCPVYVVHLDSCETIDFDRPVSMETIKKYVETKTINEDGLLKTIDIQDYTQPGARILNQRAYDIGRTSLLKFLDTPSRLEALFILIVSFLVGIITGSIGAVILMGVV